MTTQEQINQLTQLLSSLANTVNTLAATVAAHDDQIERLIVVAEKHNTDIAALAEAAKQQAIAALALERQWQAYINTLPRQ